VTIVAGFRCKDGIVLCADSQETVGSQKRSVPKLQYKPAIGGAGTLSAAFCGAGEGPLIDTLVGRLWDGLRTKTVLAEAHGTIEDVLASSYQAFGQIFQPGYCPQAHLLVAVSLGGDNILLEAMGPIVNIRSEYSALGIGSYMADFLIQRMYTPYLNIRQCVILAAYVLFQAKEHVEGCGGESKIAVLRNVGRSGVLDAHRVEALTKLVASNDRHLGHLLLDSADLSITEQQLGHHVTLRLGGITSNRGVAGAELETWDGVARALSGKNKEDMDELGFLS
jgi:hypothetical protein